MFGLSAQRRPSRDLKSSSIKISPIKKKIKFNNTMTDRAFEITFDLSFGEMGTTGKGFFLDLDNKSIG